MASILLASEQIEIPLEIGTLDEFRRWTQSSDFPEKGRFDFIDGQIEVDMSPENVFYHGTLKVRFTADIQRRVDELSLGHVLTDCSRIINLDAQLSAEPDIVVITQSSIDSGQVKLVLAAVRDPDSFVEIEGTPDLVVEIISDGSEHKDKVRLPQIYYAAGIPEYWLVDGRGARLDFKILKRGTDTYQQTAIDAQGFQHSDVLQAAYRLERERGLGGFWKYTLRQK